MEFWPDYIRDDPTMYFFCRYIGIPLLVIFLIYAYWKTFKFAVNSVRFYARFMRKDEEG